MKKVILFLMCLCLYGCFEKKEPEDLSLNIINDDIEVFSEKHVSNIIGENNVTLKNKDSVIDTSKIGEHKVTINYEFKKQKYKKDVTYKVIDSQAPVFINVASVLNTVIDEDIDPCEKAVFADNYDREVKCEIIGEADLSKEGKYNLKYQLTDSSNNSSSKNLVLNVLKEWPKNNNKTKSNKKHLYFDDAIKKYKTEDNMIGIDVSRWQSEIDFEKVKNTGVEFVIMRMAVQSDFDKDISLDSYFERNLKEAKRVGLKVGVYVYTTAINKASALEQAEWVASNLKGEKLDFPIAYDWENWSKFKKYKINTFDLSDCVNTFNSTLNRYGYDVMLYSSKFYLEKIWINRNNLPVWLAHYTSNTNYKGNYILWQLSNVGKVDGIKTDVDIDVYYPKKKEI